MLEDALVLHGAPTLASLKTGSLLNLACPDRKKLTAEINRLNALFQEKGVALTLLREHEGRALLYLYRVTELNESLQQAEVSRFLKGWGYQAQEPDAAIAQLRCRLQSCKGFPHEIGIFLGYPLSDVQAFIQNKGQNCLCCGYWKVYSNANAAMQTFARYRKCTEVYMRLFAKGCPLSKLTVQARPA